MYVRRTSKVRRTFSFHLRQQCHHLYFYKTPGFHAHQANPGAHFLPGTVSAVPFDNAIAFRHFRVEEVCSILAEPVISFPNAGLGME